MLTQAWSRGLTAQWLTADAVSGRDRQFRKFLEDRGQAYVLAVPANQRLFDGEFRTTVSAIADAFPSSVWRRASVGVGSKGPREYDGAELDRLAPACDAELVGGGGGDPFAGATPAAGKGGRPLVPLSVPEVRKLLLRLVWSRIPDEEQVLAWSAWRRAHQHRAQVCHDQTRGAKPPD
jgi:hypothetical protein